MERTYLLLQLSIPLALLFLGFVAGKIAERRHYASIHRREEALVDLPAVSFRTLGDERPVQEAELVVGAVVVSVDHYKRFLMAFRRLFGGEVKSYASLIDRGRREAVLRMKESRRDADLLLNCRIETATISSGSGKTFGTVEIVAYATAIVYRA